MSAESPSLVSRSRSDGGRVEAQERHPLRECLVLLALAVILVLVVRNLFGSANRAESVGAGRVDVQDACQELLDEMRITMVGAIPVLRASADQASSWLEQLEWSSNAKPIPSTRLPRSSSKAGFCKESAAGSRTGNAVLFAVPSRRVLIRGSDGRAHRIRTYRLVCYYLAEAPPSALVMSAGMSPMASPLTFARFVSVRVADASQFEGATDSEDRDEVLRGLASESGGSQVRWLWRRDAAPANSFLRVDPTTGSTRLGVRLEADPRHAHRILSPERFSVATNFEHESVGVASLARRSSERGGFPHGFEVQFAGPASAPQVALHLTLIRSGSEGLPISADLRSIAVVRSR